MLQDVQNLRLDHVDAPHPAGVPFAVFRDIADLVVRDSGGVADLRLDKADTGTIPK